MLQTSTGIAVIVPDDVLDIKVTFFDDANIIAFYNFIECCVEKRLLGVFKHVSEEQQIAVLTAISELLSSVKYFNLVEIYLKFRSIASNEILSQIEEQVRYAKENCDNFTIEEFLVSDYKYLAKEIKVPDCEERYCNCSQLLATLLNTEIVNGSPKPIMNAVDFAIFKELLEKTKIHNINEYYYVISSLTEMTNQEFNKVLSIFDAIIISTALENNLALKSACDIPFILNKCSL